MGQRSGHTLKQARRPTSAEAALPEMVDRAVHAEERQDKGTGPAVTLPDEVAARVPRLAQPFLCDGSVQLAMVPPAKRVKRGSVSEQRHVAGEASHRIAVETQRKLLVNSCRPGQSSVP